MADGVFQQAAPMGHGYMVLGVNGFHFLAEWFQLASVGLSWPQVASVGLCLVYARLPLQAQTMSVQILTNLGQYVRPRGRHPMDHAPTCMKSLSMGGGGQNLSSILHVCMRYIIFTS